MKEEPLGDQVDDEESNKVLQLPCSSSMLNAQCFSFGRRNLMDIFDLIGKKGVFLYKSARNRERVVRQICVECLRGRG